MSLDYEIYKVDLQLRGLLQDIHQEVDMETGEITEDWEYIHEQIEMLVTDKKNLLNDLLNEIRNLEPLIKNHREEEKRIADRRHVLENRVLHYKDIVLSIAEKEEGKLVTENWKANIRTTPKVINFDLDIMPDEINGISIKRFKVEPEKREIIKLHKKGIPVPGTEIGESKALVIKYK